MLYREHNIIVTEVIETSNNKIIKNTLSKYQNIKVKLHENNFYFVYINNRERISLCTFESIVMVMFSIFKAFDFVSKEI